MAVNIFRWHWFARATMIVMVYVSFAGARTVENVNPGWKFIFNSDNSSYADPSTSDASWDDVNIPHTFRYENYFMSGWDWKGVCWYRKTISIPTEATGRKVFLRFDGAMTVARVYVDNTLLFTHYGGYLPFTVDITDKVTPGSDALIAIRLDNRYQSEVPPGRVDGNVGGKDFCDFGGLYRNVNLLITDKLYVPEPVIGTDAATASLSPDGGVFVRTPSISSSSASLEIRTIVINEYSTSKACAVTTRILDKNGAIVATLTGSHEIPAGDRYTFNLTGTVSNPSLWSPTSPTLYKAITEVSDNDTPVDTIITRFGMRSIQFNANGFYLNGQSLKLLGVNRHQSFPYIGYALPDRGQVRDAIVLKEMGCNYIRLSHYPQSPAFLDALDSLGILAFEEAPTWWGWPDESQEWENWLSRHYQNIHEMIRRDRNHPSVLLWGIGINEGGSDQWFEDSCQSIAKMEDATRYTTSGRNYNNGSKNSFDVYGGNRFYPSELPSSASQTGIGTGNLVGYVNSEYVGHTYINARYNSAQHQINHANRFEVQVNADRNREWVAGGSGWCGFDYNSRFGSGSRTETVDGEQIPGNGVCYHGVCDIFRIPKFSYYFHQAQCAADDYDGSVHPMVFIESFGDYSMPSTQTIKVQSNCEQVELFINGVSQGTRSPDTQTPSFREVNGSTAGPVTNNLAHPPFTFTNIDYTSPGTIRADGKIGGEVKATQTVYHQGSASKILLVPNTDTLIADGSDIALVMVNVVDDNNQVVRAASNTISVSASGPGLVICGSNGPRTSGSVRVEAGQLAFLVKAGATAGAITVTASSGSLTQAQVTIQSIGISDPTPVVNPGVHGASVQMNPVVQLTRQGILFAKLDNKRTYRLQLIAPNGRVIKSIHALGKDSIAMRTDMVPTGIYCVVISSGRCMTQKKVMIIK